MDTNNFEMATFYEEEGIDLKNFEETVELAAIVARYFGQSTELRKEASDEALMQKEKYATISFNEIENFKHQFEDLKREQMQELEDAIAEWRNVRDEIHQSTESFDETAIETAKFITGENKYSKMIEIRDAIKHPENIHPLFESVDYEHSERIRLLQERHRLQLEKLLQDYQGFQATYDIISEGAHASSVGEFLVGNANMILDISREYGGECPIPHSLKMQTIKSSF